jgi:hypothetical protein
MICVGSLYKACGDLFAGYPLAARVVDWGGTVRSMVLMLRDGDDAEFYVLTCDCGDGRPFYSVSPWHAGGTIVNIEADGGAVPDGVVSAVSRGVPFPRHGSLFGWKCGEDVTALIAVYAKYTPAYPEPSWVVMPLAGTPDAQWPPFTGEQLVGDWFWKHYRAQHRRL